MLVSNHSFCFDNDKYCDFINYVVERNKRELVLIVLLILVICTYKTLNMKHSEILDFVVAHIEKNGRAVDRFGTCEYLNFNGKRCAHSICIQDDLVEGLYGEALDVIKDKGDDIHKLEFRGKDPYFWMGIQNLHDDKHYWNPNNTLSEEGIAALNILKEEYPD